MYSFWKARKARRAAVTAINPFVSQTRQRFGEIPDSAWSNVYVIGFMSTLITFFAERNAGAMGASALASVQTKAWSEITQTESVLLGEEICFLSTAGDRTFELGCCNAASFFEALQMAHAGRDESLFDGVEALAPPDIVGDESETRLWIRYFDAYLCHVPAVDY
jgi:hypothetical protein